MYVTRPLSLYRKNPESLSLPPPEGPNSGYLVLQDEESVETCCFGLCKQRDLRDLPFPQNKNLTVRYSTGAGEHQHVDLDKVYFIPVLNQPLSSNRYYVIKASGKHKGEACTSSTEEDMANCCFMKCINDVKPRALDHENPCQQFEVIPRETMCGNGGFFAKSVAPEAFPPSFLRRKGWSIHTSNTHHYQLEEAQGLNITLRSQFPRFNFSLSNKNSERVVIGKWYCPFMFVKEEGKLKDQAKNSMFYEMTLEQQWERIYDCENNVNGKNVVAVDVYVEREVSLLFGRETVRDNKEVMNGFMWFRSSNGMEGESSLGLSLAIVERMKWEQARGGWFGGEERQVRIERVEDFGENGEWKRFGCYVLVERFALRRNDGSLVLTYAFRHTHQIQSKWE